MYSALTDYIINRVGKCSEFNPSIRKSLTNNKTFSSNFMPTFVLISSGENNVHPDNSWSPSSKTRDAQVAIASARILERRIRSRGSVDLSLFKNSEKTDIVLLPSIKSMTA